MEPRDVARAYGAARLALGCALLVAPRLVGRPWLGRVGATPGAAVALRALGARDAVMGAIALHTIDASPDVASGWQRTCAAVDAADLLATAAARDSLPAAGSAMVMAMAASGAAVGAWLGSALKRPASG